MVRVEQTNLPAFSAKELPTQSVLFSVSNSGWFEGWIFLRRGY